MTDLSWHQRQGAIRALNLHRWISWSHFDGRAGVLCIRCGVTVEGDPDDADDLGRCPGPDGDTH